ncbi:DUF370 domain-containing protein [Clostridium gasigenes]|uniref:DUF370 domain-containing protein n=1 Tax=Clostridium gasigenes TaxID=94869 RepID=A0A1H0M6P0_9CLOT|nr:DUF370 domain-containing protein [Clostridium gasigenes]SDO76064.1 hypothetical protein SAMN04488529_101342 [Clostridium gasigenes]
MKFINAGLENSIDSEKIVAITNSTSSPSKRTIKNASEMKLLIDLTAGKKTGAMVIMESGHVILSIVKPETLKKRCGE